MTMAASARELLESLFRTAVAAAHPSQCLPPNLPEPPPRGRLVILAAGKAASSMTEAAEQHYLGRVSEERLTGIAVTRHGYGRPTRHIPIVEAGHPVPDEAGLRGTERAPTIWSWCCCPAVPRPTGSRRLRASRLVKSRRSRGRCCAAAPPSAT